jgi:hypothetical protein
MFIGEFAGEGGHHPSSSDIPATEALTVAVANGHERIGYRPLI